MGELNKIEWTPLTKEQIERWRAIMMSNFRMGTTIGEINSLCDMALRDLDAPGVEGEPAIKPTHEAADAFWRYWKRNGETHVHGYYESTWGAINAALRTSGVVQHDYGITLKEMLDTGRPASDPVVPTAVEVPYPCTCRFVRKDEFSTGTLVPDSICGYHATKERQSDSRLRRAVEMALEMAAEQLLKIAATWRRPDVQKANPVAVIRAEECEAQAAAIRALCPDAIIDRMKGERS